MKYCRLQLIVFLEHPVSVRLPKKIQYTIHVLIHTANPQPRSVVIIIFTRFICPNIHPHFSKYRKTKQTRVKIIIATGGTEGLAKGIIDETRVLYPLCIYAYIGILVRTYMRYRIWTCFPLDVVDVASKVIIDNAGKILLHFVKYLFPLLALLLCVEKCSSNIQNMAKSLP